VKDRAANGLTMSKASQCKAVWLRLARSSADDCERSVAQKDDDPLVVAETSYGEVIGLFLMDAATATGMST
jgi:hypothetical protein